MCLDQSRHDDFEVLEGEEAVGRIFLMYHSDGRPRWHWCLYELANEVGAHDTGDLQHGMSDSRDQAVAAIKECAARSRRSQS